MTTAEQHFEQIERYLQGKLPEAEARVLEAQMAADPELATLVQQHRLERQGLELLVERDLMAKMNNWDRETELFQQVQPRRAVVHPMVWILRAAAIFILAVAGYWFVDQYNADVTAPTIVKVKPEIKSRVPTVRRHKQTPPHQATPMPGTDEPTEMAHNDPAPIEEMGAPDAPDYAALATEFFQDRDFTPPKGSKGGQPGSAAYNQAFDNFQDGKYKDVVSKLKPTLNNSADAIQQKELMALSLYKTNQFEAAIPYFREVAASGKQPYAQRAEWGLVLAVLNQMPAKKPLFDRVLATILSNPQHMYFTQATRLEARLNIPE